MKRAYAYVIGSALVTASLVFAGCVKETDGDDEDIIGNWKRIDDYEGLARSEAVSFTIGDFAYVGTGTSTTERFNDLWEYNTTLRYWTQKASLPGPARNSAVGFTIGSKGYVATGYDGSTRLSDCWEYNPSTNTWLQKASFGGGARYDAIAFVVNGKAYVGCGYDGNYLKDMWEYTPGATDADPGSWAQKASVGGSKRSAAMAFVVNGAGYVMGGNNNGEVQTDLWKYDASANTWTEMAKVYDYSSDSYDDDYGTIARQNGVAFVMSGYAYITTGENSSINSTTWRYDATNDRWLRKTDFEGTARTGAVAFTLGSRGFVITGRSGSLVMDNGFELLPEDEQVDND